MRENRVKPSECLHDGHLIVLSNCVVSTNSGCGSSLKVLMCCDACGRSYHRYVDLLELFNNDALGDSSVVDPGKCGSKMCLGCLDEISNAERLRREGWYYPNEERYSFTDVGKPTSRS
jgi:hypothetical protein